MQKVWATDCFIIQGGDGRQRTLVVKKVTQNEIGMSATPATAMSLDFPLPSRMSSACAAIPGPADPSGPSGPNGPNGPNGPSGPGHKLGGSAIYGWKARSISHWLLKGACQLHLCVG